MDLSDEWRIACSALAYIVVFLLSGVGPSGRFSNFQASGAVFEGLSASRDSARSYP